MTTMQFANRNGCGCTSDDIAGNLLTIDAALRAIDALAAPVSGKAELDLPRAKGRVLAENVVAKIMAPPFDNSAMDGYAIRTGDLSGDGPWILPVQDRVPAGDNRPLSLAAGHAIRIFTGAKIPADADAIVVQEAVTPGDGTVSFKTRPLPGHHIRRAGDDMRAGDVALPAGRTLNARDIAAAAATGAETVYVRRDIRVALLVTGEEVRAVGTDLGAAQIWDVNAPLLEAAIAGPGVRITEIAHAGDDLAHLARELKRLSAITDVIVTTGGVSVGDADHMPGAVRQAGGHIEFAGVAMKPGKPVSAGRVGPALWLGLPGNPVSAFVGWTLFGTRMLACLTAADDADPRRRHVSTEAPINHLPGRCELRPARLVGFDGSGRDVVSFGQTTHSARVRTLALADGLVMIPAEAEVLPKGSLVEFIPFRDGI